MSKNLSLKYLNILNEFDEFHKCKNCREINQIKSHLNIFSKGNFSSSSLRLFWENFASADVTTAGADVIDTDSDSDDDDDEESGDADSLLGKKTMTVSPTVVTNSSNPNTVLVNIPAISVAINQMLLCIDPTK